MANFVLTLPRVPPTKPKQSALKKPVHLDPELVSGKALAETKNALRLRKLISQTMNVRDLSQHVLPLEKDVGRLLSHPVVPTAETLRPA